MSLYADDDLDTGLETSLAGPSGSSSSSSFLAPADPMAALILALPLPPDSQAQADALTAVGERFEQRPEKLPEMCAQLLPMVTDGGESLLRSWTLEMVALTVGRSGLKGEIKLAVAQASLQSLDKLVHSTSIPTLRAVIPIFSTILPLLFRVLATSSPPPGLYEIFNSSKSRILSLALDPNALPQSVGVKAASWKFVQKVLLVGTRAAGGDPRLANRGDVSVSIIGQGSPLVPAQLEDEAQLLRTQLVTLLYSSSVPALLHPIINTFPTLCKTRPTLAPLLVSSMASWTPAALDAARRPAMEVKAVEKTLRAVMSHLARHPQLVAYSGQLNEALIRQKQRIELAWATDLEERRHRQRQQTASSAAPTSAAVKHELEADSGGDMKRARLELGQAQGEGGMRGQGMGGVDVSALPLAQVVEAVMAGLNAVSMDKLNRAFEDAKRAIMEGSQDAVPVLAQALGVVEVLAKEEEDEFVNPLDMELDDDEDLLLSPDEGDQTDEAIMISDFRLPPVTPLDPSDKSELVHLALQRIWDSGADLETAMTGMKLSDTDGPGKAVEPGEMWMLLLARMAARGGEGRRDLLGEFVVRDFANRSKFATVWLNEEWLAKRRGDSNNRYDTGLSSIITACLSSSETRDASLSSFLLGLPEIPEPTIAALEPLCEDTDRMLSGFLALRDLVESRPPVRTRALETLLELCTHEERKVRVMAITTVRRWVPSSPMSEAITKYALGMLRRLADKDAGEASNADADADADGAKREESEGKEGKETGEPAVKKEVDEAVQDQDTNGADKTVATVNSISQLPPLPLVHSRFLTSVTPDTVQQHVELAFALSRRTHDILDDIFLLYPLMRPEIQDTLESLLTPLVQSLGANRKLVEILKRFPKGSDKLVMKVMGIMSEAGNGGVLAGVVKGLMAERELDPRFIIPVIGELDKTEIERQIPNIVKLLGTSESARDTVRTAFASALQKMTPADLLVVLHREEGAVTSKQIKQTVEAIEICFSMATVFRSDVLSLAIQRIVDLPTPLPATLIRTTIRALKLYESLVPVIANTVLPKLVSRKIWDTGLWDGFVLLVTKLGRAGFGTLLQMPVERVREIVEKHIALRGPLKTFMASKRGARETIVQIFGEE